MRLHLIAAAALAALSFHAHAAGPFAPAAGQAGSTAVPGNSALFVQWATAFQDYLPGTDLSEDFKTPANALGASDAGLMSLGNGGRITLTFGGSIFDGPGADFAVFENAFNDTFLELARVEVSSNGVDFVRFPAYSFTAAAVGAFGSVDPTNIDGFAGKYRAGFGTPFDLSTLASTPLLDKQNIRYVRIVDVLGNGTEFDDYPALYGGPKKIYDPFKTVISAGFDLEAVGVMHFTAAPVPEPEAFALLVAGLGLVGAAARRRTRAGAASATRAVP